VRASNLSSGAPDAGLPYLLPAFAAAFLGATQFRGGRFNAWGALVAVLLLGTGTTGLSLASAPQWSLDMFTGVVLIAALAVTGFQRRSLGARRLLPRLRIRRTSEQQYGTRGSDADGQAATTGGAGASGPRHTNEEE
jgi:hypothetical protein